MIKKLTMLFHPRYSPVFKTIIQTLFILIVAILPLTINLIINPPPYTITSQEESGYSAFNNRLQESGFNTTRTLLALDPILTLPPGSLLIISGISKRYSDAELLMLDSFVSTGGVLFIIADSYYSARIASYFGVYVSNAIILETNPNMTVKSPDTILLPSPPLLPNSSLCMIRPKEITGSSMQLTSEFSLTTSSTAFLDVDGDGIWTEGRDEWTPKKRVVGAIYSFKDPQRLGKLVVLTSSSFLTNDLYYKGYSNINLTITLFNQFFSRGDTIICFEESHKGWPITSTDGFINQGYGYIIYLSRTKFFILSIILLVIVIFIITPRFNLLFQQSNTYKQFLQDKIWNRERALYDTFAVTVQPTVEESTLSTLYFQWELLGDQIYNELLKKKLGYIPTKIISDDEIEKYRSILQQRIDHSTFMMLFEELEKIQSRRQI